MTVLDGRALLPGHITQTCLTPRDGATCKEKTEYGTPQKISQETLKRPWRLGTYTPRMVQWSWSVALDRRFFCIALTFVHQNYFRAISVIKPSCLGWVVPSLSPLNPRCRMYRASVREVRMIVNTCDTKTGDAGGVADARDSKGPYNFRVLPPPLHLILTCKRYLFVAVVHMLPLYSGASFLCCVFLVLSLFISCLEIACYFSEIAVDSATMGDAWLGRPIA